MAKTKERPKRAPRAKQKAFAGMEDPNIPEIEYAADHYHETMLERVALSDQESEAKLLLIQKMKDHKLELYKLPDGRKVILSETLGVKILKPKKAETNGDAGVE